MNSITPTSSFDRNLISSRQLKRADPEAASLVDSFGFSDTVGAMKTDLKERVEDAETRRSWMGLSLAGVGMAALAVASVNPLVGLAVASLGTIFFGPGLLGAQVDVNQSRAQEHRLDELAERTEQSLLKTEADGTVSDRRFIDRKCLLEPVEVSRDGEVLKRSVRYTMDQGREVSVEADVKAGTVTLKGPEGEATFPGTLELPTPEHPSITIARTDQKVGPYAKTELRLHQDQALELGMVAPDGQQIGTLPKAGDYFGNGYQIVGFDDQSRSVAIQSPVASFHLTSGDRERRIMETDVNDGLTIRQRLDFPTLEPLQVADMNGRTAVVGAHFQPPYGGRFEMKYDAQAGLVRIDSPETGVSTVRGELTKDGRILMLQDGNEVAQSFSGTTVRLHVKSGAEEFHLYQRPSDVPYAKNDEGPLEVRSNADQSFTVKTDAGEVRVAPALTSWQLSERTRAQPARLAPTTRSTELYWHKSKKPLWWSERLSWCVARFSSGLVPASYRRPACNLAVPMVRLRATCSLAFDSPHPVNLATSSGLDATPDSLWPSQRLLGQWSSPGSWIGIRCRCHRISALLLALPTGCFHLSAPAASPGLRAQVCTLPLKRCGRFRAPWSSAQVPSQLSECSRLSPERLPVSVARLSPHGPRRPGGPCDTFVRRHPARAEVCALPLLLRLSRAA